MITKDREYRAFQMGALPDDQHQIVEGYAIVFDRPTVIATIDGVDYCEVVERTALDGTEMSDVVMNFDHQGKPVARTKNNTLQLTVDTTGLKVRADLSGTEEGRRLYEEIKGGYIDKMSFAFIVSETSFDSDTRTRRIRKIKRLFDVAAVTFPAYDETSIYARDKLKAEAEHAAEVAEQLAEARQKRINEMRKLIKTLGGN